jgi:hypothetical protein
VVEGGDIKIYMKPSRTFEWTWDPQPDGIGVLDSAEPELPQTNPPLGNVTTTGTKAKTYISITDERWRIQVPTTFAVISKDRVVIEGTNVVELESAQVKIGRNAVEPLVLGAVLENVLTNAVVQTAMGPALFDDATIARFVEFQSTKHVVE